MSRKQPHEEFWEEKQHELNNEPYPEVRANLVPEPVNTPLEKLAEREMSDFDKNYPW